jgi:hypothetical protein
VETLVTLRVGQQISISNAYPFETTVEIALVEPIAARVAAPLASLPTPLRLIEHMQR